MRYRVLCINKTNRSDPHERIERLGGIDQFGQGWNLSQAEVIRMIDAGHTFYVLMTGREVEVVVATSRFGNRYVKTEADGEQPNNLLSLPECPR